MRKDAERETCERCHHQRKGWCLQTPGAVCPIKPWQAYRYLACEECSYNHEGKDCACQDAYWPCDYRWKGFETQQEAESFAADYTLAHRVSEIAVLNLKETATFLLSSSPQTAQT